MGGGHRVGWRELDSKLKALPALAGQGCQKGDSGGLVQEQCFFWDTQDWLAGGGGRGGDRGGGGSRG